MLENVSAPTAGLLLYADKDGGYSSDSRVVFLLLVNETFGDQLSVVFGDGQRHLVNHGELTPIRVLPDWADRRLRRLFSYHTAVSTVYRVPGTYEVRLVTNDSSGNVMELSQTSIVIGYEEIELKDLELTTCVDDDGAGTILITSRRRLCDVVAEWSYDNQLFVDLVSFYDVQLPVWAPVDDGTLYAATLSCRDAVADGRKEFVVGLTGRVFNTTYKFAATRLVHMRPVSVELNVTARRVPAQRAAVLRVQSVDDLESLHVTVAIMNGVFSENVKLNRNVTANGSVVLYGTEMTLNMTTLPVPELITVTFTGSKQGACFITSKTVDVVDQSDTKFTDFEVFGQVDDAGNAAVVLLAGRRVNDVRVNWGTDDESFVRTVVDLVPDERPPLWLSTSLRGYYTTTLTHRFVGPAPNRSQLMIVEHADDSFAHVKVVRLHRRRPTGETSTSDLESLSSSVSSSVLSRAGVASTSDCDPRSSSSSSAETERATETRGPIDSNVYVTTRSDDNDDGNVTLEFFARHPVRNMIVDWDMPGTAARRMINVVQPATDVDGYFTGTIRRSFDAGSLPNVTRLRMTGRVEGVAFNISKRLEHARQPPTTAGIVAMLPVLRAPSGFAEDREVAFQVSARRHYVSKSNVTIPAVVMSHDDSLKDVLVIDVTCSVRRDAESTSASSNHCIVAVDRRNGSLSLSIPASNQFSPGRYNVHIQVSRSSLRHVYVAVCASDDNAD